MPTPTCSPFLLPLTLSLIFISFSTPSARFNISSDQSALLVLKNHILTTNPHHSLRGNWSNAASICDWVGVTCGSRHLRVTAFNISKMGLSAAFPSMLGNLSFLVSLDLSHNNFYGNMPEDLASLSRLKSINLSSNSFIGLIPPSFCNISKLETLIISYNQLRGNIPQRIGNLSNLKVFVGGTNMLSGGIPSGIGNLRNLEYLYLGTNMLQGPIPEEVSNLHKLQDINLGNNSLSGSIPVGLYNISTLLRVYLTTNNLSGTLPSTMGHSLPDLEDVFLYGNHLTGKIPDSISNSSKLRRVSLELNKFSGPIPSSLGNLKLLECLHLYGNELTNGASYKELSFLTALANCPRLQDISLSGNPLRGFLPSSIANLSTSLGRIYASDCMIMGEIPDEIGNLSYLNNLELAGNDLSGSIPSTSLRGLRRLQGMFLGNNKIQGSLPDSICHLSQLSHLNLGHNQISGPIPDCIGNVTSLREIHLASNRLNSRIPLGIWNLKDLLQLDLASNSLSGDLTEEVQNLRVATYINLSLNEFTGSISYAYGSMQNLISFSLAGNKLQGSIPQSFGQMISLVSLDLSSNELTGEIPKALEGLKFLTYFNISFNKLKGEIPSGGPFKNSTYMVFESNEALCGAPELRVPRCRNSSSLGKRRRRVFLIVAVIIGLLIIIALLVFTWIMRRGRKPSPSGADLYHTTEIKRFSYQQLKQATNDFSSSNLLGSGSFGSVYLAKFENGALFAVKVFDLQKEFASKSFETECDMLSKLRHRNLTKVISACSNLDFKALLLEYMQNGSLEDWLYSDGYFLDILQRLNVMIDVASALEYLHHGYINPVIHCDLKPSNILLDKDMVGHVADFGITKLLREEESSLHTQTLATLGYMAPEYGMGGSVSSACDVYSFGILLMETFTRRRPSDEMFGGELSLRGWIEAGLPHAVATVVDSNLVREEEERGKNLSRKMQCVSSVLNLAMACSVESPKDRIQMKNVLKALEKTKLHFIAIGSTKE